MARTFGAYNMVIRKGNDGRLQAWQSMRIMRRFTRDDILTTTPQIKSSNLVKFLRGLIDVGIVRVCRERLSGSPGSKDLLELAVDMGPKPPVLWKNGQVYEPNEEMVYGEPRQADDSSHSEPLFAQVAVAAQLTANEAHVCAGDQDVNRHADAIQNRPYLWRVK